jgi:hypothetical protein
VFVVRFVFGISSQTMAGVSLKRLMMLMFELAFVVTRDNHMLDMLSVFAFAANLVQVSFIRLRFFLLAAASPPLSATVPLLC